MMIPVTLVMAYYDNPQMLAAQFDNILSMSPEVQEHLNVVIVDDGSPQHPVPAPDDPARVPRGLQIYRVGVDVRWNQDACRNIGVRHAETNWVLLTDIDHVVPENTFREAMSKERDWQFVAMFPRVSAPDMEPYKHHPNTWFMSRKMYDEVGGYDERFAGLYGTDGDFAARLRQLTKIRHFKQPIIRVGRSVVPDASTTTYLRKQPEDKEGLDRVRRERAKTPDWKPLRYQFPYARVYPR
jgi:hypothetical protein